MRYARWIIAILLALTAPTNLACGPYKVAFYEFGSLYYKNDSGQYVGIDKDLVEALAKRSGCVFESVLDSRTRNWASITLGAVDITVSGILTEERAKIAEFALYLRGHNYLITKKEVAEQVRSLAGFTANPALRVAVVKSFKHGTLADTWLDRMRQLNRVDEYGDPDQAARMVALGRADAFLCEPVVWGPILKSSGLEGKVALNNWFPSDDFRAGLVLSKKRVRPNDIHLIQNTLRAMREDGSLKAIYLRYLPLEVAENSIP